MNLPEQDQATNAQVLKDSPFGRALTEQADKANVIVEIGTWKGRGSTLCLRLGMTRPEQWLFTVEPNFECWKEARAAWPDEPRMVFLNAEARDVAHVLPKFVDLLLLDGGEESGFEDYQLLVARARVVIMDDTTSKKNRAARADLLNHGWRVVVEDEKDRYGWGVYVQ